AEYPDLQRRALPGHYVCLLPVRGAVGTRDQREHVADLLGVVLRLRVRQLQQGLLQREPGRFQQARNGEPRRDQQPVRGAAVGHGAGGTAARERRRFRLAGAATGTSKAQVEAARIGRVEQTELLDGGQRGTVPHLHRAGTEPDGRGGGRGEGERDGRRGARDAGVEVVLGEPVAGVAETFGLPREVDAVAQRLGGVGPGGDRDQVEDGQRGACHKVTPSQPVVATGETAAPGRPSGASPRLSRSVVPSYSVRNVPSSCSSGTTLSTNGSRPAGVMCGTRM